MHPLFSSHQTVISTRREEKTTPTHRFPRALDERPREIEHLRQLLAGDVRWHHRPQTLPHGADPQGGIEHQAEREDLEEEEGAHGRDGTVHPSHHLPGLFKAEGPVVERQLQDDVVRTAGNGLIQDVH